MRKQRLPICSLIKEIKDNNYSQQAKVKSRIKPSWRKDTEAVYFGHTHCPFENIDDEGVRFFNTGSAIRGMGFAPQRFEFSME